MGSPYVIEKDGSNEKSYELYSRLLKDRIIFLGETFTDEMANSIVAQLLLLESHDRTSDINMYINSPGGSISAMYAIYDTMNYIQPDVVTIGFGDVSSAGSFILAAGTKGKRFALPNTTVMIHELSSGTQGKFNHIKNYHKFLEKQYAKMAQHYSEFTSQDVEKIKKDMELDYFMNAEEAKEYGLIDKVQTTRG